MESTLCFAAQDTLRGVHLHEESRYPVESLNRVYSGSIQHPYSQILSRELFGTRP